jgi:hypothetical protein
MTLLHFGHEQSTIYHQATNNVTIAPDDSVWTLGWDGVANSNCCVFHIQNGTMITYQKGEPLPVSEPLAAEIYAHQE